MGSSKIIVLSGVYLLLGFYTVSFNAADEANFSTALTVATEMQAEQLAKTGVSLAVQKFAANSTMSSILPTSVTTMGGSITYSASRPATFPSTQVEVVSMGYYNDKIVKSTAVLHYYGSRWKLLRIMSEVS